MRRLLDQLQRLLGVIFNDSSLLLSAMTHRSLLNERRGHPVPNNERLECLGDAVLDLVVTEQLFKNEAFSEEHITDIRGVFVSGQHLAATAERMGIEPFLLMSKGEATNTGRARLVLLGSFLEAIIGAIYLDSGYQVCRDFISKHILVDLPKTYQPEIHLDTKSRLQIDVQELVGVTPEYVIVQETGPQHNRAFRVAALVDYKLVGTGTGSSRKQAELAAAEDALKAGVYKKFSKQT